MHRPSERASDYLAREKSEGPSPARYASSRESVAEERARGKWNVPALVVVCSSIACVTARVGS